MHACATLPPGLGPVFEDELRRHGARPVKAEPALPGVRSFEVDGERELVELLGRLRIPQRMGPLVTRGQVDPEDPFEELARLAREASLDGYVEDGTRWALRVHRHGEHPYGSPDVERRMGAAFDERFRAAFEDVRVDLEDPDLLLRMHLDGRGYVALWIDLVGPRSLHRRGYRAYDHRAAMNPTIAAALLERADLQPDDRVVDPMAGGGTLGIEAAWRQLDVPPTALRAEDLRVHRLPRLRGLEPVERLARQPPFGTEDTDRAPIVLADHSHVHIPGCRENVARAGLEAHVRVTHDAVDTLSEHVQTADLVAANPPYGIRSGDSGTLAATYRTLLEQSAAVLAPGGRVALLTPKRGLVERAAEHAGMDIVDVTGLQHGKLEIELLVLA